MQCGFEHVLLELFATNDKTFYGCIIEKPTETEDTIFAPQNIKK